MQHNSKLPNVGTTIFSTMSALANKYNAINLSQGFQNYLSDKKLIYFKHPMFGHIKAKKVNRFLEVHTKHHLKIIRDILNVRNK